jgi:hypothetical protein
LSREAIPAPLLALGPLDQRLWRAVENQEQAATRAITASAQEQARLEALLEEHKPPWLPGSEALHWLLKTPFRYPPLRHGSRFGAPTEPGILYGSERPETAMTEAATYLWLFRAAPASTGPLRVLRGTRTLLRFTCRTERGADLCDPACRSHQARVRDPGSWTFTQRLGSTLRGAGAEAIRYPSARDPAGVSGAVLAPLAVAGNRRPQQVHWQFRLDDERCWWGRGRRQGFEISRAELEDESGTIPHPALAAEPSAGR